MIERSQSAVLLEGKEFQIGNDRTHQVAIKLWVAPDVKPLSGIGGYEVHDWGVELSVLNGGLIERENPKSKDSGTFLAQQKVINKSFGWNIPIK